MLSLAPATGLRRRLAHLFRLHPRRLLVAPAVARPERSAPDRARVRVDGMVCTACAARTRVAFRGVAGVRDVTVDLDGGSAELQYAPGYEPQAVDLQRALDRVVVGVGARRMLARVARRRGRADRGVPS